MQASKLIVDTVVSSGGNDLTGLNIMSKGEYDSIRETNRTLHGSSGQIKSGVRFSSFIQNNNFGVGVLFHTRSYPSNRPLRLVAALPLDSRTFANRGSNIRFNIDGSVFLYDKMKSGLPDIPNDGSGVAAGNTPSIPFPLPKLPKVETNGASLANAYKAGDMLVLNETTRRELIPGATAAGGYTAWVSAENQSTLTPSATSVVCKLNTNIGNFDGLSIPAHTHLGQSTLLSFNVNIVNSSYSVVRLTYTAGGYIDTPLPPTGLFKLDIGERPISGLFIYANPSVNLACTITVTNFTLTTTGLTKLAALDTTPVGSSVNTGLFRSVDTISNTDFVFVESWSEDVSLTGMVYPLGNVQYSYGDVNGCGPTTPGTFVGADTYSLYGSWQPVGQIIGTGYVWNNLTLAQKNAFAANPDNHIYISNGVVYQTRYRTRVVPGNGNSWINIDSLNKGGNSAVYSATPYQFLRLQGADNTVVDLGNVYATIADVGSGRLKDVGTYGDRRNGCLAIPLMTVQRRNPGIYDPSLNPTGTAMVLSGTTAVYWHDVTTLNTTADCFNPNIIAVVDTAAATPTTSAISLTALATATVTTQVYHQTGTIMSGLSGRPDSMFVDEINYRDYHDRRINAIPVVDKAGVLEENFTDLDGIGNRGHQGEYFWTKLPNVVTVGGPAVVEVNPAYGIYGNRLRIPHIDTVADDSQEPSDTFRLRMYNSGRDGSVMVVGDNGNMYLSPGIWHRAHPNGNAYILSASTNGAAEAAKFNKLFPVGTKLTYHGGYRNSNTYDQHMTMCDIIGEPRNLQSRVKYTVTAGVAQVVTLAVNDVVLAANGNYYISLVARAGVNLATDVMTNTTNWVNMGNVGTAGGYPAKWITNGVCGATNVADMNDNSSSLIHRRVGVKGGYVIPLNMSVANNYTNVQGGYSLLKVVVTTNGVSTILPYIGSYATLIANGAAKGYYIDVKNNIFINLAGTGAYDPTLEANTVIQVFYNAYPALTTNTGGNATLAIGDAYATGYYGYRTQYELANSIIEKYGTNSNTNKSRVKYRFKIDKYSMASSQPHMLVPNVWGTPITHSTTPNILLAPSSGGNVKMLPRLVSDGQGLTYIALMYKELKYDNAAVNEDGTPTNTWGDSGTFDSAYNPSPTYSTTDLNGNHIVYGTKYIPLRRFIK